MSADEESLAATIMRQLADDLATGEQPFIRTLELPPLCDTASLLAGAAVERVVETSDRRLVRVRRSGCSILIDTDHQGTVVSIAAASSTDLENIWVELEGLLAATRGEGLLLETWKSGTTRRLARRRQVIPLTNWEDIAGNYPIETRKALRELHALTALPRAGRLVVFHGAPGTGKSTAVRSLINQWASWISTEVVSNGTALFESDATLQQLVLTPAYGHHPATSAGVRRPKLLVAEDCSTLLSDSSISSIVGLLALTDGLVHQEAPVAVLVTTNLAREHLVPALLRPGRCLALVEFPRFPIHEARAWLDDPDARFSDGEPTLAELLQRRGQLALVQTATTSHRSGLYL